MRLLRGLSGYVLPCGCLVGVYETYDAGVVATIDAQGPSCGQPPHRLHALVKPETAAPAPVTAFDRHHTL